MAPAALLTNLAAIPPETNVPLFSEAPLDLFASVCGSSFVSGGRKPNIRGVARHISHADEVIQPERSPQISSRSEVLDAGGFPCLVADGRLYTCSALLIYSP